MDELLKVQDLTVRFSTDRGKRDVTDAICFSIHPGEMLGIVGESGCGKSVSSLSIMGLLPNGGKVTQGSILYEGKDLVQLSEKELDQIRGKDICMIYQDALASLDPVFTIGNQMMEAIRKHVEPDKKKARILAAEYLGKVGLPDPVKTMRKYPHELSGGQRQRVMIAMAMSCKPKLLIADEPTTALDVTIQAQIMSLLQQSCKETGMALILITHDIGLIAQMVDRVLVMYAGQIVEEAEVHELYANPRHPYTRALLAAAPDMCEDKERRLYSIKGNVPEDYTDLTGCRFKSRCPYACSACEEAQIFRTIKEGHEVRCVRAEEVEHD